MIALATAASIVASIVGHPFPVTCHGAFDPGRPANGALGVTHFVAGKPQSIDLYGVCVFLGGSIAGVDETAIVQDLLVVAHEGELARLADMDEAEAQACALGELPAIVTLREPRYAEPRIAWLWQRAADRLWREAIASSSTWPAVYQGGECVR